ncbi:MAG: hypothetical protein M0T74_17570 [Desulfitobacterium hafniense]|nr:hypothetical protein [Desulfitobacterium hafniense]
MKVLLIFLVLAVSAFGFFKILKNHHPGRALTIDPFLSPATVVMVRPANLNTDVSGPVVLTAYGE